MKRTILFLLAATTVMSCLYAQTTKNPFSKMGYKKHITYTSSKGEFEEFHKNADVVEIASVYFNTKTKKVVGYVNEDKENAEVATATSAMSVDPLCEKYYWITPYAYCLNNPVKFVDPDGRKVVYFNGYLGFGSPVGGKEYWNSGFIRGAAKFFNDNNTPHFTNIDHKTFSSAAERQTDGYEYAKQNYGTLTEGMKQDEPFRLIGHSMGSAEAAGAKKYLEEKGWKVDAMVLLSSFQSDDIKINKNGTVIVDYQNTNDPVLNYLDPHYWTATGEIKNADFKVREESNESVSYRHRDLIDSGEAFWNNLVKKCTESQSQQK